MMEQRVPEHEGVVRRLLFMFHHSQRSKEK